MTIRSLGVKPHLFVTPDESQPGVFPCFTPGLKYYPGELNEQGNANVIPGGIPYHDPEFGLSRRDIYPDKHYGSWWRRVWDSFFG